MADVAFRGHHFLCSLHYQGAGYSTGFTDNFTAVAEAIARRGANRVRVTEMADDVCRACPSLQADGQRCQYQISVMNRDRKLLDAMGWQPDQELDLEAAYHAVLERRDELMAEVCVGCEWLPRCREKGPHGIASPLVRDAA
ncbi:MAG TPA: DUF1284 domain-containing protein, partial [Oscillatoriaceae cyanobacterium]